MEPSSAALLGGLIGAFLGAVTVLAWRVSERDQGRTPQAPEPLVPPGVATVLSVLKSSALVVGPGDEVLKASAPAHLMGLVDGTRVVVPELMALVQQVRRDGQIRESELILRGRVAARAETSRPGLRRWAADWCWYSSRTGPASVASTRSARTSSPT
jgi:two-component system sensor histidine kinase SenX3